MESQLGSIRKSTEASRFTDQGYKFADHLFASFVDARRSVWPWETKTRRSQQIHEYALGQNGISEDVTLRRQVW